MAKHEIGQKPLICLGVDLARPVDRCAPGKWPVLENAVSVVDGTVEPRPGLGASLATALANKTPWHSMRTLSDPTAGAGVWTRVSGIADRLAIERSSAPGTITDVLGGFSGNPLSMLPGRPSESPQPWMYVADSLLMRKIDQAGNVHQIGLPPPTVAPRAHRTGGTFKTIDLFEATTGWAAGGSAGAPTLLSAGVGKPVNTTLFSASSYVMEDIGLAPLVCIRPASMTNIIVGSVLAIDNDTPGTENALVLEVHSGSAVIAINQILYESGTSGLCSIYLATSVRQLELNSLILITQGGTTEYVRVRAVTPGANNSISIRVSTTHTFNNTATVQAVPSFVCTMFANPFNTITSDGVRSAITTASSGTPATLSRVVTLDLSQMTDGLSSAVYAATIDDFISILLRCDKPELLTEVKVMLDCDAASVSAGAFTPTAFTQNYFWRAFTASDLTAVLKNAQTAIANRQDQLGRRAIDFPGADLLPIDRFDRGLINLHGPRLGLNDPNASDVSGDPSAPNTPSRNQLSPGDSQFSAIGFRLSEMQRVGTDESRGFKDIVGVRISVLCSGAVNLDLDAWVLAGGYAPEVGDIDPGYEYAYRGRVSSTGVVSNFSPASHSPVRVRRQRVYIALTQHPSTECDKIDVYRRGGPVPAELTNEGWRYIGTVANSATPTLYDTISNGAALAAQEETGLAAFQLWALPQRPASGTAATVAGTLVKDSGTSFNLAWAPGAPIIVNGVQATLRRVISTSLIELYENVGGATSIAWEAPAPVLTGQPLPVLFEWKGEGRAIGLGDPANPSAFYVTSSGDFDSTLETLRFEIEGQVLQNGIFHNGSPFIWSTERLYRIDKAGVDQLGNLLLNPVEITGTRGLAARWACCSGERLYWLAKDGVCASSGGASESVTDLDLYPLFPHGGVAGVAVNGLAPPDLSSAQEPNLRLSFGDGRLLFLYKDANAVRRMLEYRVRTTAEAAGWFPHVFSPGVAYAYFEEGPGKHALLFGGADATTAHLYQSTPGAGDAGASFVFTAQTASESLGDPRKRKRFGDASTEVDTSGASVAVQFGFDNHVATLTPSTSPITGSSGTRQITVHDITDGTTAGGGRLATNMSVRFSATVTIERPKLYTWGPTWLDRVEVTSKRATDFEDSGFSGTKFAQGLRLHFDSLGGVRSVAVQIDGVSATVATITSIQSAGFGPTWETFDFPVPIIYRTMRIVPVDANSWQLFDWEVVFEPEPDLSTHYETQQTTHDIDEAYKVLRDALLTLRSPTTNSVTFTVLRAEDGSVAFTRTIVLPAGLRVPVYFPFAAIKARAWIYVLDSALPFAVYRRDSWVRVRGWGKASRGFDGSPIASSWSTVAPFGDDHRANGART